MDVDIAVGAPLFILTAHTFMCVNRSYCSQSQIPLRSDNQSINTRAQAQTKDATVFSDGLFFAKTSWFCEQTNDYCVKEISLVCRQSGKKCPRTSRVLRASSTASLMKAFLRGGVSMAEEVDDGAQGGQFAKKSIHSIY